MNIRVWGFRFLVGFLVLLSSVYFGIQTFRYFSDPFSTTVVWLYRFEESMELNGCVIREESALPARDGAFIRSSRGEGERVSVGGAVAQVYADQAALNTQTELDAVERRLAQLRYARDTAAGAEVCAALRRRAAQCRMTAVRVTEWAELLKQYGCVNALNFDGGGSSALVIGGQLQNSPSDGEERSVGSALVILEK